MLTRPAPPPDLTLRYGDHPDQVVDLRLPADPSGSADRPLVVVVHGGFWRAEYDRTHTGPLAADLAARGFVVAQLEYRRTGAPGGGWPGTFADVAAGLALLPALVAEALPGAPRAMVLLGHSAGGHLALWWATRVTPPGQVVRVVALAPVTDLVDTYRRDLDEGAAAALLGGSPEQVPHRYGYAQPTDPPAGTVVTVLHGVQDVQVPVEMSRRWTAGRPGVRYVELPDVEHFGLIDPKAPVWSRVLAELGAA